MRSNKSVKYARYQLFTRLLVFLAIFSLTSCIGSLSRPPQKRDHAFGLPCFHLKERYDPVVKKEAWALIEKYSPEGVHMIRQHTRRAKEICGHDSEHFASFIKAEKKDINYYISIGTSVHEMAHNFSSIMPTQHARKIKRADRYTWITLPSPHGETAFHIPGKGLIFVPHTVNFPSSRIDSRVSPQLKDHMYETYILREDHVDNVHGVYGLLNEFHAYYHDHQLNERMLRSTDFDFFEPGDYLNFLYFKFYILEYLNYGREHEAAIYDQIMANRAFVQTFLDIHDRFEKLHLAHLQFRKDNKMEQGNGRYRHRRSYITYPGLDKTYANLTGALAKPALKEMMQVLRKAI